MPHGQNLYTIEQGKGDDPSQSYPDYRDLRDRNQTFHGIVAYSITRAALATNGKVSPAWLYQASGNYFDVLDIQPYLGRFFHRSDEHGPNSAPYLVLSYPYWRNHFQSDPGAVGRTVPVTNIPSPFWEWRQRSSTAPKCTSRPISGCRWRVKISRSDGVI